MKHIEIKSEGYTYRYDFEPVPSTAETFKKQSQKADIRTVPKTCIRELLSAEADGLLCRQTVSEPEIPFKTHKGGIRQTCS